MFFEKFRQLGLRDAVMRCLERPPNFFAASKSSGIIAARLMAQKFGFRVFRHVFVGFHSSQGSTVE